MPRIHLVRHARSAHVHTGPVDLAGFHRWSESYESAGIVETETPPASLFDLTAAARVVAASDARRAVGSARLLREDVVVSPLLRELELRPPSLRGVKLPLALWALAIGVRWLSRRTHATPAEEARAREAAEWLEELAKDGAVVAVTHHSFRALLAKALVARGWEVEGPRRGHHWSVWTLNRRPAAGGPPAVLFFR